MEVEEERTKADVMSAARPWAHAARHHPASINGVVVTWVVATKWRTASTRRGFDSPLMQTFLSSLARLEGHVDGNVILRST